MIDAVVAGKSSVAITAAAQVLDLPHEFNLVGVASTQGGFVDQHSLVSWASLHGIRELAYDDLLTMRGGLLFSVFFDRIFPQSVLDNFDRALNVHPGPLPRYRGVRPLNWALKNHERQHGVTVHQMDAGIDSGPIASQVIFPLFKDDTLYEAYCRMLTFADTLVEDTLVHYASLEFVPQDHAQATIHYSEQNDQLGIWAEWKSQDVQSTRGSW